MAAMNASGLESAAYNEVAHWAIQDSTANRRASDLGFGASADLLVSMVHRVIKTHLPRAQIHRDYEALLDRLQEQVDRAVESSDAVSSEIAQTNSAGPGETYVPLEFDFGDLPGADEAIEIPIHGHVTITADIERPYAGHEIKVEAAMTVVRLSKYAISTPGLDVRANLNYDWGGDDDGEVQHNMRIPVEVKLARELGIEPEDVEELAEVDPFEVLSNDDATLYYEFDFSGKVNAELEARIMAAHGALKLHVLPGFFDDVKRDPFEYL